MTTGGIPPVSQQSTATTPTTDTTGTSAADFEAALNQVALGILAPQVLDIVQDLNQDLDDLDDE